MGELLKMLLFIWLLAGCVGLAGSLAGCAIGGYEAYGGIRSIDSRRVIEETLPSKMSMSDRLWGWLNPNSEDGHAKN